MSVEDELRRKIESLTSDDWEPMLTVHRGGATTRGLVARMEIAVGPMPFAEMGRAIGRLNDSPFAGADRGMLRVNGFDTDERGTRMTVAMTGRPWNEPVEVYDYLDFARHFVSRSW
jgi:hypothetical protein